jgi:hypothetical protein
VIDALIIVAFQLPVVFLFVLPLHKLDQSFDFWQERMEQLEIIFDSKGIISTV